VPTYNRAALLPFLFDALGRQVYPADRIELIVVDNSSSDGTEEVVRRWGEALPFPVTFRRKENRGPAASRNLGASLARGDILAFTDSDCIPDRAWIANAMQVFRTDVDIVCGPMVGLARAERGIYSTQYKESVRDTGLYPAGNLFFRRRWFDQVGGFDERYGIYPWGGLVAGEDTDLVWRAKRSGAKATFAGDVVVGHQPSPPPPLLARSLQPVVLQIFPHLLRSVPELRRTYLWRGYFMSPTHLGFDVALAGVVAAAATRRRLALLATVPWLVMMRHALSEEWIRGGPVAAGKCLAFLVQQYATGTVVLAAASARYRRLVL
jgi:glycosyltransferase involved in cell wall biosynthesis